MSNGAGLAAQTLAREARAGSFVGSPSGLIGPRLRLRSGPETSHGIYNVLLLREQFEEVKVTDKKRPTTPAPAKEELTELRRENRKFSLKNVGQ